ncbi:MAG TPA: hypothetical protein VJ386_01465 [Candidatus Deferrimicrobiaceae bacterium]|nr:hypothetical protein [Candidatus Deferrimicrobiaceae bacterium]
MRYRRPEIVIVVLLLSLCLSGCGKAGGDRAMVSSPSDPTVAKEGKPPSESGIPVSIPSRAGGVSLGLVPAGPDALTGVRAVLMNSPPGSKVALEDLRWYVNGGETRGEIDRLAGTSLRRGDVITARAQVTVNDERISVDSPKAIVQNALPEIVSVSISPPVPKKGDTLRLVVSSRDADGDPVSHRCRWFLDDREIQEETAETLSPGKGTKNSWVHAEVQVYDGIALGSKAFSQKVRIVNAPPVVEGVDVSRGSGAGYTGRVRVTDPDGDPVSIRPKSLPEGVTLSGTAVSWEESAVPQGSEIPVVLLVSDGDGGDIEYVFRISR